MSLLQRVGKTLGVCGLAFASPALVSGQTNTNYYAPQGGEYLPAGSLPGDQTMPAVAVNASGGYLVWQDNITDGSGLGISAVQLDATFSPIYGNFRVNVQGTNDQENPQVALLNGGGAVFVWQGGQLGFQHIYARFLSSSNTWVTGDVMVNTATNYYQANPAIATLTNGNVIVTWASYGQDNADGLQGIYAQILTPTGTKVGGEFLVNQFTPYNQRTPAVAAFPNGNFIITWISERERSTNVIPSGGQSVQASNNIVVSTDSIDVYARTYNSSGTPLVNEFLVNTSSNTCANPAVAVASDGTYMISWSQKDTQNPNNSWDVWARQFNAANTGGAVETINTQLYGDQYRPKIASLGTSYFVVWTSMAQDGSREGVFGQFLNENGSKSGGEILVNTTVLNSQLYPYVTSDGTGRFFAVWASYMGGTTGMDLAAQRYASTQQPLSPPAPPMVSAVSSYALSVAWAPIDGLNVANWNLYVDSSNIPIVLTNIIWENPYWLNPPTNYYNPDSTHTFSLSYVLTDGRVSPISTTASGTTWGFDGNFDGLPDNWQTIYWGANSANWPPPNTHLGGPHGPTVLQVFLWGANPLVPSTWLTTSIVNTPEGWFLTWNTIPGCVYQVQTATNVGAGWTNYGVPRFAAGTNDSVYLGLSYQGFFQITRLVN